MFFDACRACHRFLSFANDFRPHVLDALVLSCCPQTVPQPYSTADPPCGGRFRELPSVLHCGSPDCCPCWWPACSSVCFGSLCGLIGPSRGCSFSQNMRHASPGEHPSALRCSGDIKGLFGLAGQRLTAASTFGNTGDGRPLAANRLH